MDAKQKAIILKEVLFSIRTHRQGLINFWDMRDSIEETLNTHLK